MRILMYAALVLACSAGCGDDPPETGTFTVGWTLADPGVTPPPTCTTYRLDGVVVTATETATGDTTEISASCTAAMLETPKLPLGAYTVSLEAMGVFGDVAGTSQATGSLVKADQVVALAASAITVLPPTSKAHAIWTLRKAGALITCAQVTQNGVSVTNTSMGVPPVTDIWDCMETNATTDVPYGPMTSQAQVLGANDQPFGSSPVTNIPAQRGIVPVMLTIDIP